MEKQLLAEMEQTAATFEELAASFTQEQINTMPFEGSWTPGQVIDHVLKSLSKISSAVYATTTPSDRDPALRVAPIRNLFLDFDKKLNSPDFILPDTTPLQKEVLLASSKRLFEKIITAINTLDLSVLCLDFQAPRSDKFTRLEWIYFILYHTQRHIHQLKKIAAVVNKN